MLLAERAVILASVQVLLAAGLLHSRIKRHGAFLRNRTFCGHRFGCDALLPTDEEWLSG
jgi:hypothetical protein